MQTDIRKTNLIQSILKVDEETTLSKLESILHGINKKELKSQHIPNIYDFLGIISPSEAEEMTKVIHETCESINDNDWK